MEVQPDFKELLALFDAHNVEYMIVGGYALAFHGAPRFTGDLDLLVKPDPRNARQIIKALEAFGFVSAGLNAADFQTPDTVVQLGFPPVRVDLLTSLTGVSWQEAASGRASGTYGDTAAYFIGRQQLIANKRALGRKKDLADLEAIGAA
jgi:hypothetical protein